MPWILLVALLGPGPGFESGATTTDRLADAQSLVHDGRYREALENLEPLLRHDKENVPARMTAAAACLGLGDPVCADKHLKRVADLAPATPGYQLLRGRTLLLEADRAAVKGDTRRQEVVASEAADAFASALSETPDRPKTLALRAMALRAAGRPGDAREAYRAWIDADPRNADAYGATAAFLAEAGEWDKSGALIDRAPQDDPKLLHEIRVAVLRNGITVVPWAAIRGLFESVDAEETDASAKRALSAYRAIRTSEGEPALLAVLDYLDSDPDDHLEVRSTFFHGTLPDDWATHHDTVEGMVPPTPITSVAPAYPEVARRARIEGKVTLLARIRKDGTVTSVHALSSTNPMFERAAEQAVSRSRYTPATLRGEVVEVPYFVRVDFRLQ